MGPGVMLSYFYLFEQLFGSILLSQISALCKYSISVWPIEIVAEHDSSVTAAMKTCRFKTSASLAQMRHASFGHIHLQFSCREDASAHADILFDVVSVNQIILLP